MGMAASQARLLSLQARQSNLEYQGQQINQERTILSQQCTALYNSLLAMTVPTPPSTSDFTSIEYSGADGATTFTLGSIVPTGDTYSVEMKYKKTGHYLEEKGSASVTEVPQYITKKAVEYPAITTKNYYEVPETTIGEGNTVEEGSNVMKKVSADTTGVTEWYEKVGNQFVKLANKDAASNTNNLYTLVQAKSETTGEGESAETTYNYDPATDYAITGDLETETSGGLNKNQVIGLYVDNGDGTAATKITEDNIGTYFTEQDGRYTPKASVDIFERGGRAAGDTANTALNPDYSNYEYYVADKPCMTLSQAVSESRISDASKENYLEAIRDAYPELAEKSDAELEKEFQVYFTKGDSGLEVPHFVSTTDLQSGQANGNGSKYVVSYDYTASGSYTSSTQETGCQLTFDTSGRITEIKVPTGRKGDEILGYKTIELTAATVTDNAAYQDAYNEYEYAQYEYDKKQQEINAKTEIIQQQDRNLELKLQRLDNERTQITTEIEAVDKVINENIEDSYKTFSG